MDTTLPWIVLATLLILDMLAVAVRASLSNARLPRLLAVGSQDPQKSVEPMLAMLEKIGFRLGLRLVITVTHLLLALSAVTLLSAFQPGLSFWALFGLILAASLLVIGLEISLEGVVRRNPESWLVRLFPLTRALEFILRPFSILLVALMGQPLVPERIHSAMTEDELKTWVEVGQPSGSLEKGERQMIYSIFHFGDTLCREIMVPRIDILALEANTTVPEATQALTMSGHSRVPVYEETIDNVIGLLYAKDLLRASLEAEEPENIRPFLRPAYFVPEAKKADELLREMQAHSIHMAIVVDEYGGMAGLVTMEDIVEEIVGEIRDEYDQGEELLYQRLADDEFIFHGRIGTDDVNELLATHLTGDLSDTVGGYIYGRIGRVPVGGEHVRLEDWELTVAQISGRRIRKIHARRKPLLLENREEPPDDDTP